MLSLILPTLGQRSVEMKRLFDSLESQISKNFELIVVSQDNHEIVRNLLKDYTFKYKQIELNKRGLSLARNEGLKYVRGGIVGFSDDDCWYKEDAIEYITRYVSEKNSEIVTFQHIDKDTGEFPKKYPESGIKKLNKMMILKQASIDIFVNTYNVPDYCIGFDERFGLGSRYNSGEENIYLMDLRNKGYRIDYEPRIVSYHPNKVEKKDKLDSTMIIAKGPLFLRLFGTGKGIFMYTVFMLKKSKRIKKSVNVYKAGLKELIEFKRKVELKE